MPATGHPRLGDRRLGAERHVFVLQRPLESLNDQSRRRRVVSPGSFSVHADRAWSCPAGPGSAGWRRRLGWPSRRPRSSRRRRCERACATEVPIVGERSPENRDGITSAGHNLSIVRPLPRVPPRRGATGSARWRGEAGRQSSGPDRHARLPNASFPGGDRDEGP